MTPRDKPALETLKTPTRILVGERDHVLDVGLTRAIYDRLTCEKDLIVLPGAGHMLPTEERERSVPLVAEWLKNHLATKPVSGQVSKSESATP
jgi:pimeloyl-ACP methyl ester carboxylesterase